MARARSCSGRASASRPRSRRIGARLFRSVATVGVVRAVGGLGDGQGAFLQRPGLLRQPQVPQDHGPGCSGRWRRRGGPGRRRPRRWPGRVLAAAGPPPAGPGPAGSWPGCSGRWRRRGGPGRRRPRSMARARSCSGRASSGCPRSRRIMARLFRSVATSGWSGAVGGLGDGQGAFLQRPGLRRLAQVLQDQGQVVQADGDVGVVRAVGGLGDGQGAFLQRPGLRQLAQVPQDQGQVVQVGGDGRGGPGRRRPRSMARARSCSGRAAAGRPRSCRIRARLFRRVATVGWSGP